MLVEGVQRAKRLLRQTLSGLSISPFCRFIRRPSLGMYWRISCQTLCQTGIGRPSALSETEPAAP